MGRLNVQTVSANLRIKRILRDGVTAFEVEVEEFRLEGDGLRGKSWGKFVG